MECMNKCGTKLIGRQQRFCSDKCRMAQSRTDKSNKPEQGMTNQGMTQQGMTNRMAAGEKIIDKPVTELGQLAKKEIDAIAQLRVKVEQSDIPNFGQDDCECMHCKSNQANGAEHTLNHGPWKPEHQLIKHELNRVSLPGDIDHTGKLTTCS